MEFKIQENAEPVKGSSPLWMDPVSKIVVPAHSRIGGFFTINYLIKLSGLPVSMPKSKDDIVCVGNSYDYSRRELKEHNDKILGSQAQDKSRHYGKEVHRRRVRQ